MMGLRNQVEAEASLAAHAGAWTWEFVGEADTDKGCEAELSPPPPGVDDRRLQMRAYDLWIELAGSSPMPAIVDLRPDDHPSFAPYSVLLDFSESRTDPRIAHVGERLAAECGMSTRDPACVSQLPPGSLLARFAEHYLKVVISPEPIGFEAQFVNQRDRTILYRGILLPFTGAGPGINFVFGVISWKEAADPALAEDLLGELRRAVDDDFACAVSAPAGAALPAGVAGALPGMGMSELDALDAAGREFRLVAIGRAGNGEPVVLGEVIRTGGLFASPAAVRADGAAG